MARYIDSETMIKRLEKWNTSDDKDKALYNFALNRITEQQIADVVEVIRCKNCIYRWFNGVNLHTCVRDTANGEPIVNLEDFCSYGKKVE